MSPFLQLLDAYFSRAFKEQKEKFLKNHGFSLLANQLYLHQGTRGLLEVFLEMLFGRPVGLEEEYVQGGEGARPGGGVSTGRGGEESVQGGERRS